VCFFNDYVFGCSCCLFSMGIGLFGFLASSFATYSSSFPVLVYARGCVRFLHTADSLNSDGDGKVYSPISFLIPNRVLEGRMRREGRGLLLHLFSFSSPALSQRESKNSGKRGARVVRGDKSKEGALGPLASMLLSEGRVGMAKKDRSSSGSTVFALLSLSCSKMFSTGRLLKIWNRSPAIFDE